MKSSKHDIIQGKIVHEYDDILEADNKLPRWWLATFYLAIVFSMVYWGYYHLMKTGPLPMEAYQEALAKSSGGKVSEEILLGLVADSQSVQDGKTLFTTHCVICHEVDGRGKIGANLTDNRWIHGGKPLQIHQTINEGVLTKGMPAWGQTLGPVAVQKLTAFVLTLKGKNIPGKDPEGEEEASP